MNKILFLSLFLFSAFVSFAQEVDKPAPLSPEELKLRAELETDKSFQEIGCGLYQLPDLKHPNAQLELKLQKAATRVRLEIYRASLKRSKTVKAKFICGADEGGTVSFYLIVERRGKITYIRDSSRDPFGGLRVTGYACDKLIAGHFVPVKIGLGLDFVPLAEKDFKNKIIILKCQAGDTAAIF